MEEHGITFVANNDIEGGEPYAPPRAVEAISEIDRGVWGQVWISVPYLHREPPERLEAGR